MSEVKFVQRGHFTDKGGRGFQMGNPHYLVQKTSDFSKFMVGPNAQGVRELSQYGHFADKWG